MREERPIIALDFPAFEDVKNFLEHFPEDEKLFVKIGMEFFYAVGPEIVHYLKGLGHSIFLDLKLQISHVRTGDLRSRYGDGPRSRWCRDDARSQGSSW